MKLKNELYTIISEHTGKSFDEVWNDSDRDFWMTSAEAKEYGMIDEVLMKKYSALKTKQRCVFKVSMWATFHTSVRKQSL